MNLYALDTATLDQCKLDATDQEVRQENSVLFLEGYNFAYERIIREKILPWTTEAVTLDANKAFNVSTLTNTLAKIRHITRYADFSEDAGYVKSNRYIFYDKDGEGSIVVPYAEASGEMFVSYEYMPVRLSHTELLFNISGGQTDKTIPIDEAITASMVSDLVGSKISVFDASLGTYQTLTIVSVVIGAAGAATITVTETITGTLVEGDIIYTTESTKYRVTSAFNTPQMSEQYHLLLTDYAKYWFFSARGTNYSIFALELKATWEDKFARIVKNTGARQELLNAYSSSI